MISPSHSTTVISQLQTIGRMPDPSSSGLRLRGFPVVGQPGCDVRDILLPGNFSFVVTLFTSDPGRMTSGLVGHAGLHERTVRRARELPRVLRGRRGPTAG